jgi:hypothetical protein
MKDYYKSKGEKYETSWSSSLILNIDDASALAQYFQGKMATRPDIFYRPQ